MITLNDFLSGIQRNEARITHYQSGGDGSGGGCDCIGLIIGAIRLAGGKWSGTHGSNWAARNAMRTLNRITEPFLGEVVYKAKEPGEKGYDLPAKYKTSGDLKDYYHVGVVTGIDPLCITHCTSVAGGIKRDSALGQWAYGGELKYVDYGGEDMDVMYQAIVTAVSGRTVNLRANPSRNARVLQAVPVGAEVDVLQETDDTWSWVFWNGEQGYMMRTFLRYKDPGDGDDPDLRAELESLRDQLAGALETIDKLLGVNVG